MKKKYDKTELYNMILYAIYIVLYLVIFIFFEHYKIIFDIRYYILFFIFAISLLSILKKYGKGFLKKFKYKNGWKFILFTGLLFIVLSFVKCQLLNVNFSFRTVVQTSLFLLPALYALNITNLLSAKNLITIQKIITVVFVIMYFLETKHNLFKFFDISNWKAISFVTFDSFTESHICSESFLNLFLFFFYINRFVDLEEYGLKKMYVFEKVTLIFTLLSFKRLSILFVFLLYIFSHSINYDAKMKKNHFFLLSVIFTVLTVFYTNLLKGVIVPGFNVTRFSTNRDWILSLWARADYFSYGYGTSLFIIGRYLEMDLVQIYLEMGIICLFVFCASFFKTAGCRIYTNVILIYVMLNLITSSTMPWTSGWILLMINIFSFSNDKFTLKNNDLTKLTRFKIRRTIDEV